VQVTVCPTTINTVTITLLMKKRPIGIWSNTAL
jgi:hypothetical protein